NNKILRTYPLFQNNIEIVVKDLGYQLRWSTVFFAEYIGPLLIYLLFYYLGQKKHQMTFNQKIGLGMGAIHYIKRVLETQFVHVFSRESMPLSSCWKNFVHYWLFFGTFIGVEYFFYYKETQYNELTKGLLVLGWVASEFMNMMCHIHLSQIRKNVETKKDEDILSMNQRRKIPKGWGFNQVSCANYLWETCSWIFFSAFSRCYSSYFFTFVSFIQMFQWALQKH
ncbi:hypothetical protein IMG5_176950, partial [Ichthyophthirius multifiliis]